MNFSPNARKALLLFSIVAFVGPNGYYLYSIFQDPTLNQSAMQHPVALTFMAEAMMLLGLFLWYVRHQTRSWAQVLLYLVLTFLGSLAFSLPLFLYRHSKG